MDKKSIKLSIKTTSLCNRLCKNCQVRLWMGEYPNFHTSLEQIGALIHTSYGYDYKYEYIILSGGEPLLWENLVEGTRMLYAANLTKKLIIFTNGKAIGDSTAGGINAVLRYVDSFRIAQVPENQKNIDYALKKWGKLRKNGSSIVNVVDRRVHAVPPIDPVPDSVPAICQSESLIMFGDVIQTCAMSMIYGKMDPDKFGYAPVRGDFIGDLIMAYGEGMNDRFNCQWCSMCIANQKVLKTLKREQA